MYVPDNVSHSDLLSEPVITGRVRVPWTIVKRRFWFIAFFRTDIISE